MDNTTLSFYEDTYRTEIDAVTLNTAVDERLGTVLITDRTIFHPHGGGQKGDRGTFLFAAPMAPGWPLEVPILDTRGTKGGPVLHVVGPEAPPPPQPPLAASMRMRLDWGFRSRQMRLHSAAHLLHVFTERIAGRALPHPEISDILPGYGLNVYTSDLGISSDRIADILREMNRFTAEGHSITTYAEAERPHIRFWRCGDDVIPCGGTHPRNTSEIGPLSASMSRKKGKTKFKFELVE